MAAFRSEFQPRSDDIPLTSFPKTGATWLMALCHNILHLEEDDNILTKMKPHDVVPALDVVYLADQVQHALLDSGRTTGRLLHTHLPYSCLSEAVRNSGCKFVHLARNPKDMLVSMWHFYNKIVKLNPTMPSASFPMEGAVESFCSGVLPFGPFYEHVVGYWEESKKRPDKVLFLKYEELRRDPKEQVRKLASFLGAADGDDDDEVVVEKVLWRSSFGRLKELEVNKNGVLEIGKVPNVHFFRKGTVRDWNNYLTPQMAERIDQLTQLKLQGIGLSLDDF
ncbi:unnamed protein product [Linum tenue]|uniref:Sulfotransferase n=1 Tax=Linum tenue TaxID=586396 RepID=A0AAV0GZY2_9ROSI|nr:unnamed protein product [Linum tenue]